MHPVGDARRWLSRPGLPLQISSTQTSQGAELASIPYTGQRCLLRRTPYYEFNAVRLKSRDHGQGQTNIIGCE